MTSVNHIICHPINDNSKRFLLGEKGHAELLAIGLNPSTANEEGLDPTSRNIQTIANNNGCDGWYLVNLYPLRTSKPSLLPEEPDLALSQQNIDFIMGMIKSPSYNITKVLCCWGNQIDKHKYLREQATEIIKLIEELNISCQCISKTGKGHPFHPAPTPVNTFLGGINNVTLKPFHYA